MRPTRRFWTLAALAGVAGLWAVVVGRPLLVVGVCGVCAWLLAQQYAFLEAVRAATAELSLTQRLSSSRTAADATTYLTVSARTEEPHPLSLRVEASPPVAAAGAGVDVLLEAGATEATHTVEMTWPVAGTFQFDPLEATARDRLGLFEETVRFESGPAPTITVEPRSPRNVHVGSGGEPVAAGFGEHESDRTGRGLEPAEVRRYVAGDTFRQIDWKATARLDEVHVRDFTAQSDRETQVFVDHRAGMATGSPGETKLAFARHVALAFVEHASEYSDPIGCHTVGDEGVTAVFEPRGSHDHLRRIRRHLRALEATGSTARGDAASPTQPDRVREVNRRLAGDDSRFGRRLAPFFERPNEYVRAISDRPLFGAVSSASSRRGGALWTVIVTDDDNRTELRETVKIAGQRGGPVLVFLLPTVLFEPGGLDDLDEAYERYLDFESFRRDLASLPGVSAFEVGPADRLSSVLANAPGGRPIRQER